MYLKILPVKSFFNIYQTQNYKNELYSLKSLKSEKSVKIWKLECNIVIEGHAKKSDKNNKKVKDYSYKERLERRMRGDLKETFKIINEISNF